MCSGLYLRIINIDACTKFDKNPSIKYKQNSDVNPGHNIVEN